jgi:hypothetical protein
MRKLALAFASAGFPIFPVNVFRRGDRWRKVPYVRDWTNAATTDPETLAQWWQRWPLAIPGLPLERCGLVVVDADRHGGTDGVAALHALGPLPPHPVVTTKSGGEHHWFRQPAQSIRFAAWSGAEVLGIGRFVVGYAVPEGEVPELPEVFWRKSEDHRYPRRWFLKEHDHDPVVVADLTAALHQMNAVDWRGNGERGKYMEWYELLLACKYVGIALDDFTEWCVGDPDYAHDAEDIACHWHYAAPKHGGAFWRELSKRKIKVRHGGDEEHQEPHTPRVSMDTSMAADLVEASRAHQPTHNLAARLKRHYSDVERSKTDQELFSWSCLFAEIIHERKLKPSNIARLIQAAATQTPMWKTLGRDGVQRTIANAFRHVEEKYLGERH